VAGALAHDPDACIIDLSVRESGLEAARQISPACHRLPLLLGDTADDRELVAALRAGASGYMPRAVDAAQLTVVLRAVLAGAAAIPRPVSWTSSARGSARWRWPRRS
jgi:DNA-binding NarL/FixJ family response regulator